MKIRVECHAGYRGEETPRRLIIGEGCIAVVAVQDRWLAPDHRYFKLIGEDDGLYIVRHDPHRDEWQLTYFSKDPRPSPALETDPSPQDQGKKPI